MKKADFCSASLFGYTGESCCKMFLFSLLILAKQCLVVVVYSFYFAVNGGVLTVSSCQKDKTLGTMFFSYKKKNTITLRQRTNTIKK